MNEYNDRDVSWNSGVLYSKTLEEIVKEAQDEQGERIKGKK